MIWEEVVQSGIESDEAFRRVIKNALEKLHISAKELSNLSGVSESSIYKILSGKRANPRLSTYRMLVNTFKRLELGGKEVEPFIAIIAARPTLDAIESRYVQVQNHRVPLKEYAATSIEDVITSAVRAQQEGAKAIVCAPIVSTTVEKIAKVPVSACPVLLCKQPLIKAAEVAALKII